MHGLQTHMGINPYCYEKAKRRRIEAPLFQQPAAYGPGDEEEEDGDSGICHGDGDLEDDAMDAPQMAPPPLDDPRMVPPPFEAGVLEGDQPCTLAGARQQARRALENPRWREWATHMVTYCEEHYLADVTTNLFPSAEVFQTKETFRFMQLKALYPGASFAAGRRTRRRPST